LTTGVLQVRTGMPVNYTKINWLWRVYQLSVSGDRS
jgi:hypothetical protein